MATREISIYKDKETGDINQLRDKKLADLGKADPNGSVAATDYVELMTSTGEPIKVTQQSLATALGTIFSASDPKTFTKLLGMNSGSPMGIGPSDLASVLGVGAVKRNAGCRVLYPASIFVQNGSGNTFYLKFKVPETSYSFVNYSFIVSDNYDKFSIINLYVYHTKQGGSITFVDQKKLVIGTQIASYLNYDANSGLLYIILKLEGFKWTTATLCDIYTKYFIFSNPSIFDTFNYTVETINDLPSGSVEFT